MSLAPTGHHPIRVLEDLDAVHLVCRDISHSWRASTVRIHRRQRRIVRTLVCANCGCCRQKSSLS